VSHVLGQFSKSEAQMMSEVLRLATDSIEMSLKQGIAKAMSLYNNRVIESTSEAKGLS
jgi:PTH1 family peptidyl-tRNA hydrolase